MQDFLNKRYTDNQFFDCTTFVCKYMVIHCTCFCWSRHSPYYFFSLTSDIAAEGTTFRVLSFDAVLVRDSNQSSNEQRSDTLRVTPQSRLLLTWEDQCRTTFPWTILAGTTRIPPSGSYPSAGLCTSRDELETREFINYKIFCHQLSQDKSFF